MSLEGLAPWLADRLGADEVTLSESWRPPLNGASNDTQLVDASWRGAHRLKEGRFVVRRSPAGPSVYHSYDLAGQYRTMAALSDTNIPVAPLVGYETDSSILGAPFYVMRAVDGEAPPDIPPFTMTGWVLEATADQQRTLYEASIDMMARVHRLDPATLDLAHLPQDLGVQLRQTEAWFRWAADGRSFPVLEATLDWIQEHQPRSTTATSLNWGDARIGNMLYEDFQPVCVLDWEMAALGPPEVDLGWWLFINRHHTDGISVPRLPGFPDDATTISLWEEAMGRRAQDIFFYDVLAGFRFGIIVVRDAIRAIEAGTRPADWDEVRNNTVTRLLSAMLDL